MAGVRMPDGTFYAKVREHLDADVTDDWTRFVEKLFPCARIIFNYRRDTASQSHSSFYNRSTAIGLDEALESVNKFMRAWHTRLERTTTVMSYLVAREDIEPDSMTQVARWLGFPQCRFHSLPHANDAASFNESKTTSNSRKMLSYFHQYHQDYEHINVTCAGDAQPIAVPLARFYLHEDLGAPFRNVEAQLRLLLANGSLDQHAPVMVAEHLTDIYMLDALRRHPQRTFDEKTADLHFTSALLSGSVLLSMVPSTHASTRAQDHWQRMSAFAKLLAANPSFREGKRFFVASSVPSSFYPPRPTGMVRDPLYELLLSSPHARVVLGTTDPGYIAERPALMSGSFERYSVLPYRVHDVLSSTFSGTAQTTDTASGIFFRGNCERHDHDLRSAMLDAIDLLRPSRLVDVRSEVITGPAVDWSNDTFRAESYEIVRETAMQMREADLCLCPIGDTASSRRLFDALAARCVPVITTRPGDDFFRRSSNASGLKGLAIHARRFLPFPSLINWAEVAFFWRIEGDAEKDADYLRGISSSELLAQRHRMRAAGRRAFDEYLNVQHSARSVITAILLTEGNQPAASETAMRRSQPLASQPAQCIDGPGARPSGGRVVFLKTHKTASGSTFSILGRAAVQMGLRVATPNFRTTQSYNFGWPLSFPDAQEGHDTVGANEQYLRDNAPFDVLMHHADLAPKAMSAAVPNAPFVTIVRDPIEQFRSAWDYFYGTDALLGKFGVTTNEQQQRSNATLRIGNGFTISMPINTWTERAAFAARVTEYGLDVELSARLINPSAKQLGWPMRLPNGTASRNTSHWLASLDELFSLIMVQERFNESLLMLGHCLGLDAEQLVPPLEGSVVAKRGSHEQKLTHSDRAAIYALNDLDLMLHSHASHRFGKQVHAVMSQERRQRAGEDELETADMPAVTDATRPWWASMSSSVDDIQRGTKAVADGCSWALGSGQQIDEPTNCNQLQWSEIQWAEYFACLETDDADGEARCTGAGSRQGGVDSMDVNAATTDAMQARVRATEMVISDKLARDPSWTGARVVTVSQGTTGTHAAFNALTHLGLPAVHWIRQSAALALGEKPGSRVVDLAWTSDQVRALQAKGLDGGEQLPTNVRTPTRPGRFWAHDQLKSRYEEVANCASDTFGVSRYPDANGLCVGKRWLKEVDLAAAAAISEGYSMTDVPYPSFLTALVERIEGGEQEEANRTLYLLLERDADEWARKRLDPSHMNGPVCARQLWTDVANPFDLYACVRACIASDTTSCVVTMHELGPEAVADAYRRQLDELEQLFGSDDRRGRLLRVNLFASNATDDDEAKEELAERIERAICNRAIVPCGDATAESLAQFVG